MDSTFNNNESSTSPCCHQSCCVSSTNISHISCNSFDSSYYVLDVKDHSTLISDYNLKNKKNNCQCSLLCAKELISNTQTSQPWITVTHILCTAVLALLALYLASNVLIFEKKSNGNEIDDIIWRSSISEQRVLDNSTTELPTSKDKCEPLYVLVYAHCCVWFLFLVLDHFARHIHHKTLRCRGHLRFYAKLSRLAAIPFQLVSFWTVLLAIFIAVYAQQDGADMQVYCDANMFISPKNGIAVLLVIEFICVTISSLIYANSMRKFSLDKPPPDVYGWEENNYFSRWTPHVLQSDNNQQLNEEFVNYERQDGQCLLDLLEYYVHTNRELAATLGLTSQRLRQLIEERN